MRVLKLPFVLTLPNVTGPGIMQIVYEAVEHPAVW
jgi:hypothetical protein